ncbi:MAG: hypothetical protein RQM92_09505 [Candidatus Syntrophopropionicum ammoniitolerans]
MVVVLGLIVQFTKSVVKKAFDDVLVRLYAFVWALIIVSLVYWCQGLFNVAESDLAIAVLLTIINAIVVTLAAMGGYEFLNDPLAEKEIPNNKPPE